MSDRLSELPEDTSVAVVTFSQPEFVRSYVERYQPGFPVLVDPDRHIYRAYGLERGKALRVWGWRAGLRYAEILLKRRGGDTGLAIPNEDTMQLGGDFVVDRSGKLAYGFWGEGPDDRPSLEELAAHF